MVEITSGLMGNSLIFSLIAMVISFIMTIYSLYLNYKQAEVLKVLTKIHNIIEEETKKKKV